jgi:hypothetical protein
MSCMSQAVAIQYEDIEVIHQPERDLHEGRPMRPEYAERGAAFQLAYEMGRWTL